MNAAQAVMIFRGALREAREAVRKNDRDRALAVLRMLDHALIQLEAQVAPAVAGLRALGELTRAAEAIFSLPNRRRR